MAPAVAAVIPNNGITPISPAVAAVSTKGSAPAPPAIAAVRVRDASAAPAVPLASNLEGHGEATVSTAAVAASAGTASAADRLGGVVEGQAALLAEDPSAMTDGEKARRFVMSMCRDLQGRLWVGCEDTGVWCFDPFLPKDKQWRQFTTRDGLGDDNGYAVACDRLGRVWAGHLNHGVSVYNGQEWQNYEVIGGLSRGDTLSGPLGERVFHITVDRKDGDVWVATSCGLLRYSESRDIWTYYTRAEGLPSDQASSIAFDKEGDIYVATQCDGIVMAQAADDYKHWRQATGPEEPPAAPSGEGLPSNLINDILVADDGTVYAATDAGLCWSTDRGTTWLYIRGRDWADKVRGRYAGAPNGWVEIPGAELAEDYVTCLAEDDKGLLWVGHRQRFYEALDKISKKRQSNSPSNLYVMTILPRQGGIVAGCYGEGLVGDVEAMHIQNPTSSPSDVRCILPSTAKPPATRTLTRMIARTNPPPATNPAAALFAGDDWMTQGDWVGRYGRRYALLCAANSPYDDYCTLFDETEYSVKGTIGPHHAAGDTLRHYLTWARSSDARVLYEPTFANRRQAEWDDHGEAYLQTCEGPDLYLSIRILKGPHRISLYFFNKDGHTGLNRIRDYTIVATTGGIGPKSQSNATHAARARVKDFWGGVYKQFGVIGPGVIELRIQRRGGFNTILSGVFVDQLPYGAMDDGGKLPSMGGIAYGPMPLGLVTPSPSSSSRRMNAVIDLWNQRDAELETGVDSLVEDRSKRVLAYRAIQSDQNCSEELLRSLRWVIPLWTKPDRVNFDYNMAAASEAQTQIDRRRK